MTVRAFLLGLALAAALAGTASAAEVSLRLAEPDGVRLGTRTDIRGRATQDGLPLAGRTVRLEARRHPFVERRWRRIDSATTAADGGYAFSPRFERNHRVRVRLEGLAPEGPDMPPEPDTLSPKRSAWVLPAFTLSFTQRGARRIRIRQVYTVPRRVRLRAATRFYVGPCKPDRRDRCTAGRAPLRAVAKTRRVRAGRYVARATVRILAAYEGRFAYASCFPYSKGSGMGDPDLRCPRKSVRLRGGAARAAHIP